MPFTQQQAIALLSLLSEGKLISELNELLNLDTDNNFVAINSGSNDAKKIKIPLLRGYKGTYNASTNTPSLSNTVGLNGDMYVVSVAGSRDFGAGTVNLLVDDIIIYLNGKYLKTNGAVTGSLDLQGAYNNSSPKTITVADSTDGTLTVKDSATNINRDEILQVQDTSGNILFYVQRNKVYIKDNLGIGTENPTVKLDVRGSVKIGKDGVSTYLTFDENPDSGSGSEFYLTHDIAGNILKFTDDNSNDLIAMERQYGRVGIGTTSPSEKLEVDGNALVEGNIYERFDITSASQQQTLADNQRVINFDFSSNATLEIPASLNNKFWQILNSGSANVEVLSQVTNAVTINIIHNGKANNDNILTGHSAILIRTASDVYSLIK